MSLFSQLLPILISILHTIHPLIQISPCRFRGFAHLIPGEVELVVAVIVSLCVTRMARKRDMTYRADNNPRDHRTVWVRANDRFIHDLFRGQNDSLRSKRGFLLFTDNAPYMGVPICIRALHMDDGYIRIQRSDN